MSLTPSHPLEKVKDPDASNGTLHLQLSKGFGDMTLAAVATCLQTVTWLVSRGNKACACALLDTNCFMRKSSAEKGIFMREKLQHFMVGRYGADQFGQFLLFAAVICMVISMLFRSPVCNLLAILLIVLSYYRMLSKNHSRRYAENMKYLKYSNKVSSFFRSKKQYLSQLKTYHIYRCPSCKQKLRIPRGKGKISISCPKCRTEFIKKS